MVGLQALAGAYQVEFGSYPDEPAHVVTGIAVDRFVRSGDYFSPERFFLAYYQRYPKVAIGHWPPLLYVLEAAATLSFSPSRYAILGLQALLSGVLAWLVFRELKAIVSGACALVGALAFLFTQEVRVNASMAMAEILLTLAMFLACLAFARFAETRQRRDAIWFAVWTSAAVLTKGTGWAVLLIPLFVVAALREWKLPLEPSMRWAAAVVALICVPWQIVTMHLVTAGWTHSEPYWEYVRASLLPMTAMMVTVPGVPIFVGGAAGAWATVGLGRKLDRHPRYWLSLLGLVLATWVFHVLVPATVESRRLILAVPALFVLAGAGAAYVGNRLSRERGRRVAAVLFLLLSAGSMVLAWPVLPKRGMGFVAVAAELRRLMPRDSAALVVSDSLGEGSVISEFALKDPDPRVYLVRGSKLLSSQGWNNEDYHDLVQDGDQCAALLASVPTSFLVMDRRPDAYGWHANHLVEQMLQTHSAEWRLMREFPSPGRAANAIALYQWSGGPRPLQSLPEQTKPLR